jgi:hypothetical protein
MVHRREMIEYCAQVKLAFGPAENAEPINMVSGQVRGRGSPQTRCTLPKRVTVDHPGRGRPT